MMLDEPPDSELIAQAQAGDDEAFGKLYKRYHDQIGIYIARIVGNDEVRSDLAQETFIKAWKAMPRLRDSLYFTGWLYRIAKNVACDYLRQQKRYKELEIVREGPEERIEGDQLLKAALALNRVPSPYRDCVIYYCLEECSQREVAERVGIKESSVSKYVSRGLERLREEYNRLTNEQGPLVEGEQEQ